MEYYVMGALVLAAIGSLTQAQSTTPALEEVENQCDGYCLKVLKPMLEHFSVMQTFWMACDANKMANTESRLDKIEGQVATQVAQAANYESSIADTKRQLAEQKNLIENYKNTGRKPFQKIGSKYYYIEQKQKLNWFAAAHKCHELGAHLISIQNQREVEALKPHLTSLTSYWTDVNDLSEEGVYLSLTSGMKAPFLRWRRNEPNNANNIEHCINLLGSDNQMNDLKCNVQELFICELFSE